MSKLYDAINEAIGEQAQDPEFYNMIRRVPDMIDYLRAADLGMSIDEFKKTDEYWNRALRAGLRPSEEEEAMSVTCVRCGRVMPWPESGVDGRPLCHPSGDPSLPDCYVDVTVRGAAIDGSDLKRHQLIVGEMTPEDEARHAETVNEFAAAMTATAKRMADDYLRVRVEKIRNDQEKAALKAQVEKLEAGIREALRFLEEDLIDGKAVDTLRALLGEEG